MIIVGLGEHAPVATNMPSGRTPIHRAYDLNGVTLGIAADEEQSASFLDSILASLSCAKPPVCDWIATLKPIAAFEVPADGRRIFEGRLPEGLPSLVIKYEGSRMLVVPGHFAMSVRRSTRSTEIHFVPGKEGALGGTAAFWMLNELLAAHDQHLLHGACLVNPSTNRTIAVFAPSGTGKTTTALALARSGLWFAGDDALVLDTSRERCGFWSIPRDVKVHRRTAALLPWLGPALSETWIDDEQALELGALSSLVMVAPPRCRQVGLVIALGSPNEYSHEVAAMAKPHALAAIASDNLRITPDGLDDNNAAALVSLARLITTTPVLTLSVGPDLTSLTPALIELK